MTFEIVGILLKGELHIRAIADRLGTNHMTVLRKMRRLVEENVLDFKKKGRNKVYFVKKTAEARNYVLMVEICRLSMLLKRYPDLRRIVTQIQRNRGAKLAVLFGSYAKGTADKTSDADVFLETESRKLKHEIEEIDSRLSVKIGLYDKKSPLIREIEKNHVIIKGVETYYEKSRFFE